MSKYFEVDKENWKVNVTGWPALVILTQGLFFYILGIIAFLRAVF